MDEIKLCTGYQTSEAEYKRDFPAEQAENPLAL